MIIQRDSGIRRQHDTGTIDRHQPTFGRQERDAAVGTGDCDVIGGGSHRTLVDFRDGNVAERVDRERRAGGVNSRAGTHCEHAVARNRTGIKINLAAPVERNRAAGQQQIISRVQHDAHHSSALGGDIRVDRQVVLRCVQHDGTRSNNRLIHGDGCRAQVKTAARVHSGNGSCGRRQAADRCQRSRTIDRDSVTAAGIGDRQRAVDIGVDVHAGVAVDCQVGDDQIDAQVNRALRDAFVRSQHQRGDVGG